MIKRIKYNRLLKHSLRASLSTYIYQKTLKGTRIANGIEYNNYPAPSYLLKAMESQWANELISNGSIRLSPFSYYQALENSELGDRLEGLGEYTNNAHTYSASSINEVFIWCGATPSSKASNLLKLDDKYDVVIRINNVVEFVSRIALALKEQNYSFSIPHIGKVNYDRSSELALKTLSSQMTHWNSFQKAEQYSHQKEYRVVLSDLSFTLKKDNKTKLALPINLSIGNCTDIIQIIKT